MILGSPQAQLGEVQESLTRVMELARKSQPERIEIKDIRLQNEKLRGLLSQPYDTLQGVDIERLRSLSSKYEQLVMEFDYAKATRISKADFLTKLRRVLEIGDSNVMNNSRGPSVRQQQQHVLNGSQSSIESQDVSNQFKQQNSRKDSNLFRIPSSNPQELELHAETGSFGNFGKKDSVASRSFAMSNKDIVYTSKRRPQSSEMRDIVPLRLPIKADTFPSINDRMTTEISHIRNLPTPIDSLNRIPHSPPMAHLSGSVEGLDGIREGLDRNQDDDVYTPIQYLNDYKGFPKPMDEGYNDYFPIGEPPQEIRENKLYEEAKESKFSRGMISDPEAFGTYKEDDQYKHNIEDLFKRADILKKNSSFKSQFTDRSKSKSKHKSPFGKSKMRSTYRTRDLEDKEELINKLAGENLALRKQLEENNNKMSESQNKKQTFPEGTLQFQKYVIANELLKQENAEIYSKLNQLEEALEELSKENYIFRGHGYNQSPSYRKPVSREEPRQYEQPLTYRQASVHNIHPNIPSIAQPSTHSRSERGLPTPKHALIQLPPELGHIIDSEISHLSQRPEFDRSDQYYHPEYQGPVGSLNRSSRSARPGRAPQEFVQRKSSVPSMLPEGIPLRNPEIDIDEYGSDQIKFPSFRKSLNENHPTPHESSPYSENDFPPAPSNLVQKTSKTSNPMNRIPPLNDNSSQKFFTANNISISGEYQRIKAQQHQSNNSHGYDYRKRGVFDEEESESHREYQDFPRMASHDSVSDRQEIFSPLLPQLNDQQSVEKSFDTFKVIPGQDPRSQRSLQSYRSSLRHPQNFSTPHRSVMVRNKVAFFKKSLVLIRDDLNYELAFKRSDLNKEKDTLRVIFYINNKQSFPQSTTFDYEYDRSLYSISQGTKLSSVNTYSQGREELVIKCLDDNSEMKSIVCHLTVGDSTVDFVVPAFFFKFDTGAPTLIVDQSSTRVIQVDKQFSPQFVSTLIPLVHSNPEEYLQFMKGEKPYVGQALLSTKHGLVGLKLEWMRETLRINCASRWLDQVAWVLAEMEA